MPKITIKKKKKKTLTRKGRNIKDKSRDAALKAKTKARHKAASAGGGQKKFPGGFVTTKEGKKLREEDVVGGLKSLKRKLKPKASEGLLKETPEKREETFQKLVKEGKIKEGERDIGVIEKIAEFAKDPSGIGKAAKEANVVGTFAPGIAIGGGINPKDIVAGGKGLLKGGKALAKGLLSTEKKVLTSTEWAAKLENARHLESVNNVAYATGESATKLDKMIKSRLVGREVSKLIANMNPTSFANQVLKSGWKYGKWVAGGAIGTDAIIVWYALDNIIGGQKFFLRDLRIATQNGEITPEEAMKIMTEQRGRREFAAGFATKSSIINPILWPFSMLIHKGIESDKEAIEFEEEQITNLIG